MKFNLKFIILAIIIALIYIIPATLSPYDSIWYESLLKPIFTPTPLVLMIVWFGLFILMAISATSIILTKTIESKRFYLVLLILNYIFIQMYSYIMFELKDIYLAFITILVVWVTAFMLFLMGYQINRKAGLLIIPLIIWIAFAAFIQVGLLKLNF